MLPLPSIEVFSRADARDLGWSNSAISRAIRSGRIVVVRRGQFAAIRPHCDAAEPDYVQQSRTLIRRAHAACRARRDSVVSHHSAVLMHGLPLLRRAPASPALTVAPRAPHDVVGVHIHRATLPAEDVVTIDGVLTTSVARTLVDLARSSSTAAAVVTIDAALHRRLTTPDELATVLLRCWNWPGIRRANRATALGDARAESPLESVSRLVLGWLRLPPAALQTEITTLTGRFVGRVDFYWDEFGVVGEADGAGKYELAPTSLIEEKRREERLNDLGLVVVRWGWADFRRPDQLRNRVERAFGRGIARSRSGFPPEWSAPSTGTGHWG